MRLARLVIVLLACALLGALAAHEATPANDPPGRDPCSHGATGKPCRPDPSTNGKDCDAHGNNGGVNEDHCAGTTSEPPPTTTTEPTTTTSETTSETTTPPATTSTLPATTTAPPVTAASPPLPSPTTTAGSAATSTSTATTTTSAPPTTPRPTAKPPKKPGCAKGLVRRGSRCVRKAKPKPRRVVRCKRGERVYKGVCRHIAYGKG